jgi:HK97 family phage portal protein
VKLKSTVSSFFNRIPGVLGWAGGNSWYPNGTLEGVAPFQRVSSDAGVQVESGVALQVAAAWACVTLLSETVGTLPLLLKVRDASNKWALQTNSSTFRMLTLSPNRDMTAIDFWQMMVASLCLWGNAYAVKGTVAGRVVSLTPLRPEGMTVARGKNGDIFYRYQHLSNQMEYTADQILHVKGFGVDGLMGLSPIAMARQSIGRSVATDQASGKIFQAGLSASGFIKYQNAFKTQQQRDEIRNLISDFTGSSNFGKVMVLENGMDYQGITMNPDDAQMLETRMFNVEEVCRWYRVPPQLIGHVMKSSSWASSIESTTIGFRTYTLRPYLRRIEQAVSKSLALGANQLLLFDVDDLDCADAVARAQLDSSRVQNGLRTRNELRERDGLDAHEGADELTVQSNLVPLDKLGETPPAPTPPVDPNNPVDPNKPADPNNPEPPK